MSDIERVEAIKAERKAKWERIQTETPEVAEFLTEMTAAFGKAKRTAVWIGEERIL